MSVPSYDLTRRVCFAVNTSLINTHEYRGRGKHITPFHFTRRPPRQTGCLVGAPSYLAYLGIAKGASAGFMPVLGGEKPPPVFTTPYQQL